MKRILPTYFLLQGIMFLGLALNAAGQAPPAGFCNIRALSDSCTGFLKPFHYSGQNALHVALKSEPQEKEVIFPAFKGETYRIIINTRDMPKGTEVAIYDQDKRHKKRQPLFTNNNNGVCNFDTGSKSGRLYIDYTIPAATSVNYSGCAAILIGFENDSGKGAQKKK